MTDRFLILGHRGSPKAFPENTPASFEEALREGADGFETDLRLLSDRTAILFHDVELGETESESLTFTLCAERGGMIARLDVLARFTGRGMMVLEVKRSRWEETLLAAVSGWPDVVLASFDHSVLTELLRRGATVTLGISWIFPNYRFADAPMVESCHARGIRVMPWTANRRHEWARLRELGCDGVITDVPGEAVRWRDAAVD
jgi:glycerophosphoryl diester phosphodiesterase